MSRKLLATLMGLLVWAGSAAANGPLGWGIAPGYANANSGLAAKWGYGPANQPGCPPGGGGGGAPQPCPGVLGPWYLYWPYEAHFITPAHPQYPYWPSAQTLHGGSPHMVAPVYPVPSYWK